MYQFSVLFLLLTAFTLSHGNTLQSTIDIQRLKTIFEENIHSKDISTLYHAIKGLTLLKSQIPDICEDFKTLKGSYDLKNTEQMFHFVNAAVMAGCHNYLHPEILSAATHSMDKEDSTLADIYHAVYLLKALGKGSVYDREEGLKNLIKVLKKDDSPANYAYLFALCEHMGCQKWTTSHAEGVILAADESNSKALFFEGGLPVTSFLLSTIIRSYKSEKKASPLSEQQRLKFAEYLASRRSVTSPRGAALLLEAALAIADDEPTPISIAIKGKKYVTSDSDTIEITVSDLIGRPVRSLKPEEVVAQSGTRLSDDVVVLSKQPLVPKPNDPATFVLNLNKIKAQYGLYKIALSAGGKTASVNIAVLGEIRVNSIEVGIGDVDGTTSPKITTVTYPNKLQEILQADHLQKVTLKWTVRDAAGQALLVQQAFVQVAAGDDEAIFVAEPDTSKAYKVELNVGAVGALVRGGAWELRLVLGHSAAAAPLAWHVATARVATPLATPAEEAGKGRERGPLAEIAHEFRAAEARPARVLSDAFACACAAPLLLLLVLWARLGLNLANMPLSLSAAAFHLALGGSFGLYGLFWLRLSMFETVRYMVPLGAVTFLAGHRLLRRLARDNKTR